MTPEAFEALARPLPDALLLVGTDGTVRAANRAGASALGRSAAELVGRPLAELVDDEGDAVERLLARWASSSELLPGVLRVPSAEGSVRLPCRGAAVRSERGVDAMLVRLDPESRALGRFRALGDKVHELSQEVARRAQLERERLDLLEREKDLRQQAERAVAMKDQFLATVSHELRTPLNAIVGWTQVLLSEELSPEIRRAAETIDRNARMQAKLIEDLLDISRIVAGKIRLDVQPVQLVQIIQAARDSVQHAADAKRIRIQLVLDADAGIVSGDPGRLQQVVWNLLTNAIQHTPKEGRVQVRLERVNSHVEVVVSDTGTGIEPDLLPHVFTPFLQAEGASRHGLGLGLSIARRLVELHGGTIEVESEGAGKGATFVVKLPTALYVRPSALTDEPEERELDAIDIRLDGVRVLVVDDHVDSLDLVVRMFSRVGAVVESATSADAALRILAEQPIDVLVSDIEMPLASGYALLRQVRQLPGPVRDVPAVALTAYARPEDRIRSLLAGFQVHVPKPVDARELVTVVANLRRPSGDAPAGE